MRPATTRVAVSSGNAVRSVSLFSWSGATVFALSLAYGAYSYVIRFDMLAAPGSTAIWPAIANVVLFGAFALHHSVLARTGVKRAVIRRVGEALERPLYVWLSSLLFLLCCWLWQPLPGVLYSAAPGWRVVGVGVQLAGVVVTLLAARRLDARVLAGLRPSGGPDAALEISGLYGLVRHPIYFGWVLMVLGAPHMTATRASFALTSMAYLAVAVPFEERSLVATFGEAYRHYQRRVRWRMVPGLY